jgi:hypothetical protein
MNAKPDGVTFSPWLPYSYEHDEEPYVTFPQGAQLGPESDSSAIADVVARARESLTHWR